MRFYYSILIFLTFSSYIFCQNAEEVFIEEFPITNPIHNHFLYCDDSLTRNFNGKIEFTDSLNGEIILIRKEYINGKKVKAIGFYDNKQIYRETTFNNCKKEGVDTRWYKNGYKEFQCFYERGEIISASISWFEDGSIENYSDVRNGDSRIWYPNGSLKTLSKKVDSVEGAFYECDYYENGVIKNEGVYNNGVQTYKLNHSSGQKMLEGIIVGSLFFKIGHWQVWYENGQKSFEYFYHDTIPNLKVGTWSWWDEQGHLIKQEFYNNGELVDTKDYIPGEIKKY